MPCYTLVQAKIKDRAVAEAALRKMGVKAKIEKVGNVFTVTPEVQTGNFVDKFMTEYQAEMVTKQARADQYTVSRTEDSETGEVVLVLRQY